MTREIAAEASVWIARLHGPDRSKHLERECLAWQAQSPAHRLAFERCTDLWMDVAGVDRAAVARAAGRAPEQDPAKVEHAGQAGHGVGRLLGPRALASASVSAVALVAVLAIQPWRDIDTFDTGIGEQRLVVLQDGTRMTALCCAWHALNVHDDAPSINLALVAADAEEYEPQAIRILLAALRRRLLLETGSGDDWAQYLVPLRCILTYLSVHPEESSLRASLVNAMSIESAGLNGVRLLALLTIDVLREGSPMLDMPPKRVAASEEEFEAFLDPAIAWMRQQPAVELGSMRFSAADAAVAIEILSDKSIEIPGAFQPLTEDWPAQAMAEYSQQGPR